MLPSATLKDVIQKLNVIYNDLDDIYNKYDVCGLSYVLMELSDAEYLLNDLVLHFRSLNK